MTCSDMSFLLELNENKALSQKELTESRNLNNATVTRALERLDDKRDKRKKLVSLTSGGRETVRIILNKHEKLKKEIFSEFSAEEYDTMMELLDKLLSRLEFINKE